MIGQVARLAANVWDSCRKRHRTVINIGLSTSSRFQFVIPFPVKLIGDQGDCLHL